MASVEIRVNVLDFPPHTFIQITGSDGTVTTVGYSPTVTGIWGVGQVTDNTRHAFDATSGSMQISELQYQKLMSYVARTENSPPVYDIIGGSQCSVWVSNGLYEAGIINAAQAPTGIVFIDGMVTFTPYMDFVSIAANGLVNLVVDGSLGLGGQSTTIPSYRYQAATTNTTTVTSDGAFNLYDYGNGVQYRELKPGYSSPTGYDQSWKVPTDTGYSIISQDSVNGGTQQANYNLNNQLVRQEYIYPPQPNGSIVTDVYRIYPLSGSQVLESTSIQSNFNGNKFNVSFGVDANGQPYIFSVNSINGVAPTDPIAAAQELTKLGVTQDMLTNGTDSVMQQKISGVVSVFDGTHPTGAQTLANTLTGAGNAITSYAPLLIDSLSLIKAIQTGQPLPIVASGLRIANDFTSIRVPVDPNNPTGATYLKPTNASINGASNVAGGVLSLMSLDAALKRGDSMAAITAGAQAISYSASAYASFGGTFSSTTASSINSLNTALPYLNIVNSIVHGDAVGAAMGAIAMTPAAPVAWAYYAFNMIDSLFSSSEAPPEAWGSAHAQWSGFTATSSAVGGFGGLEAANQTYGSMLSYLDQLAAQQQTLNPGSSIGVIANRLPGLSYRNYTGYQITDIDPLTGVQVNPDIKYDLTGRPYNAPTGSVQASQSLTERMIRVALARGAIAPQWEVQTADCEAENDGLFEMRRVA